MKPRDPVPFEKVEQLAESIRNLRVLEGQKAAIQAQLIRRCLWAINQTTAEATRRIESERRKETDPRKRNRPVSMAEPSQRVREDRTKALLYLEYLATQLEDQSVRLPDNQPKEETSCS